MFYICIRELMRTYSLMGILPIYETAMHITSLMGSFVLWRINVSDIRSIASSNCDARQKKKKKKEEQPNYVSSE
jgi:hypothetical protein